MMPLCLITPECQYQSFKLITTDTDYENIGKDQPQRPGIRQALSFRIIRKHHGSVKTILPTDFPLRKKSNALTASSNGKR